MHSIVILGDVRHHLLSGTQISGRITGGTLLMTKAIRKVLKSLPSASRPHVQSYTDFTSFFNTSSHYGEEQKQELLQWQIQSKVAEMGGDKRFCLTDLEPIGMIALPQLSDVLRDTLIEGGFRTRTKPIHTDNNISYKLFESLLPKKSSQRDNKKNDSLQDDIDSIKKEVIETLGKHVLGTPTELTPDVLVIDDLGLQIGKIKFTLPKACPLTQAEKFAIEVGTSYWRDSLDAFKKLADYEYSKNIEHFNELRQLTCKLAETSLSAMVARLNAVTEPLETSGKAVPIEPVVLLSAADHVPILCEKDVKDKPERTIWQHIYDNKTLRRRTVVLLDAKSLRDKISISSGLSWERTAQDAIVEFSQSDALRPFLKFGHIVIRFGMTGALLISNEGNNQWGYTLYFNPEQDDVAWTHKEDGVVLGATSIIAASIVEQLNERCSWRKGQALLPDLRHALDRALLRAVHRLDIHFELGYGKKTSDFEKSRKDKFDDKVFESRADAMKAYSPQGTAKITGSLSRIGTQRASVPTFRSGRWSILAQSCQTELNNVARNIVLDGAKITLNSLESPVEDFVTIWLDEIENLIGSALELDEQTPRHHALESLEILLESLKTLLGENETRGIRQLVGQPFWKSLLSLRVQLQNDKSSASKANKLLDQLKALGLVEPLINELKRLLQSGESLSREMLDRLKEEDLSEELLARVKMQFQNSQSSVSRASKISVEILNHLTARHLSKHLLARLRVQVHGDNKPNELLNSLWNQLQEDDSHEKKILDKLKIELDDANALTSKKAEKLLGELREAFDKLMAKSRDLLHQKLVRLINDNEPCRGWTNPISTPVLRLGKSPKPGQERDKRMAFVDRKEVENIRAVKRMIEQYLRASASDSRPERPLSVAVFGPPGSGKSVAVKKIIEMMENTGTKTKTTPVNLSQLPSVEALGEVFQDIALNSKDVIPIVFFDEFDSFYRKKHGWLKYFLAVMEDGEFLVVTQDGRYKRIDIKRAIFVFAGGTCDTFEKFSLAERSWGDPQLAEFSESKGPDFVSRLGGHINVVGINPSGTDDGLYLIRRALALRFLISQKQDLKEFSKARIDDNILNAFLYVPHYIHGSRSMRMLVDLCINRDQDQIVAMSEVPPIHQLNMQVDGKAFAAFASGQMKPVLDD